MQPWAIEHGTLWALETGAGLPSFCPARTAVDFVELGESDSVALAVAMDLPGPDPVQQRLQSGRRCFSLKTGGQIASYGWVTRGAECVGELEREFRLQNDEAYVWDCRTLPAWRGQRFYSALLSHIIYRLGDEGIPRIWIGASRQNQASIRGFVNAGFQPVVDCTYGRFYHLSCLWIHQPLSTRQPLRAAAYRILHNEHERRVGQLMIGLRRGKR